MQYYALPPRLVFERSVSFHQLQSIKHCLYMSSPLTINAAFTCLHHGQKHADDMSFSAGLRPRKLCNLCPDHLA